MDNQSDFFKRATWSYVTIVYKMHVYNIRQIATHGDRHVAFLRKKSWMGFT